MKSLILLVATCALFAHAQDASLTLTYNSLANKTVTATSTVISLASDSASSAATCASATHGAGTSYTVHPADLAYPTYSTVVASIAGSSPNKKLQNTSQLLSEAEALLFLFKNADPANCVQCQTVMHNLKGVLKKRQEDLSDIAEPFCDALALFISKPVCIGLFKVASTDVGGAFSAMDMRGRDGQTLCAYMFGLCDLPPVNKLDLHKYFKGTKKPAPKTLTPSKKPPLKVLHLSDYHLDLRHVVGSEADCSSNLESVCCRVYPYTNTSAAIKEPASLFGNYLCDTPEALATSVFRAVPKVTGFEWCEFSFGLFTGDLVSHDLWEVTKPYVEAEILGSYQQFFDGLGGVPMYPTLGNHDTFPHAFTAFPSEDTVLPANASYSAQELYNYQAVSSAWANYGWLSAEEAQAVVATGLGIYRAVTKEGLVIISLNSDVWYYLNFYAYIGADKADHTGMFSTFVDYLLEAEAKDQAVWVIQHVPTGGTGALPAPSNLYYAIIDRFSGIIRGTFFGHTHQDEFSIYYANNGTNQTAESAVATAYIMQSITPYTNNNAGFRYYLVDAETFEIIDSLNYYANISDANAWTADGQDVVWEFEYSARETYGYGNNSLAVGQPLSPAWWHNVAMEIKANETTFETYTDLRTKKYRPYSTITGTAKQGLLCGLTSGSVPLFEVCLNSTRAQTSFL